MPLRLCSDLRCNRPVHYKGRCAIHASRRNAETRSHNKPVYNTKRWKVLRDRYLSAHPLCECGCGQIAEDVHHKQDIRKGGNPWAWDNLEALTHSCHSQLTRREQTAHA